MKDDKKLRDEKMFLKIEISTKYKVNEENYRNHNKNNNKLSIFKHFNSWTEMFEFVATNLPTNIIKAEG